MKKVFVLVLLAVLLTSFVCAEDVGYILQSKRNVDSRITGVFTEMNLSYKLIEDKYLSKEDLTKFKFIFIDDAILRNTAKIPVYNYPSVIMNQNYGPEWGLTDADGVSQLASTSPLSVKLPNNGIEQVYTRAKYANGVSVPYFYLDDLNKADPSISIARTYGGGPYEWGDVISVIPKGARLNGGIITKGKLCFYGIAKTEYWTQDAKNLFEDCVGSVLSKCSHDIECGTDSFIGNKYCINSDLYQNYADFSCSNPDTRNSNCINSTQPRLIEPCAYGCNNGACLQPRHDLSLIDLTGSVNKIKLEYLNGSSTSSSFMCGDIIKAKVKVKNTGNFVENASLTGSVNGLAMSFSNIVNSAPGDENERSSLSPYVTLNLAEGYYNVSVSVNLPGDQNLSDNSAKRQIFVSCPLPECTQASDCGSVTYENNYCIGKNVSRNVTTPICNI
ncbi:MAG: hypothetical protein NT076_04945, partial [Candidatus Pacearchaeota archaeon]|nr:hypothetical protein [Candidatus Pacearchaeota archaeon]